MAFGAGAASDFSAAPDSAFGAGVPGFLALALVVAAGFVVAFAWGVGVASPTVAAEKTRGSSSGWGRGMTILLTTRVSFDAAASAASMAAWTAAT